jgi:hypothetical protein
MAARVVPAQAPSPKQPMGLHIMRTVEWLVAEVRPWLGAPRARAHPPSSHPQPTPACPHSHALLSLFTRSPASPRRPFPQNQQEEPADAAPAAPPAPLYREVWDSSRREVVRIHLPPPTPPPSDAAGADGASGGAAPLDAWRRFKAHVLPLSGCRGAGAGPCGAQDLLDDPKGSADHALRPLGLQPLGPSSAAAATAGDSPGGSRAGSFGRCTSRLSRGSSSSCAAAPASHRASRTGESHLRRLAHLRALTHNTLHVHCCGVLC